LTLVDIELPCETRQERFFFGSDLSVGHGYHRRQNNGGFGPHAIASKRLDGTLEQ
jgi:hypothetical protein